jgi:hypothetical protein
MGRLGSWAGEGEQTFGVRRPVVDRLAPMSSPHAEQPVAGEA